MVMAQLFSLDPRVTPQAGELGPGLAANGCPSFAPTSYGYYGNAAELRNAASAAGHIAPRVESDGVVRKLPGTGVPQRAGAPQLGLDRLLAGRSTRG